MINQPYTIIYDAQPAPEVIQILGDGIAAYAKVKKDQPPIEPFAYLVQDKAGNIVGGCNGSIYYGCLYIDQLWIDERFRGQKIGTEVMRHAEQLAINKGCLFLTVNTMDWEALDFYKKLGFEVEFQRTGYLHNSTFYFLRKNIV